MNVINAPELEINSILYGKKGIPRHVKIEQKIVANLINYLASNGWRVVELFDGDEFVKIPENENMQIAMEYIFNLDESLLYFSKDSYKKHTVSLVNGNEFDIISDWSYSNGDADGFNALMEKFNPEDYI